MLIQKIDETDGKEYLGKVAESELDSSLQEKVNAPTGSENNTVRFDATNKLVETDNLIVSETFIEVNSPLLMQSGNPILFYNNTGTYSVSLANIGNTENTTYYLPETDGTDGQVLSTNGTGQLSWESAGGVPTGTFKQTLTYNSSNELITTNVLEVMDDPSEKKVSIYQILNTWKRINAIEGISAKADPSGVIITLSNPSGDLYIKKTNAGGSYTLEINLDGAETTEGTILVRQSDGKFKFKNISNYLGSSTGVKVLRLPFDKATLNESDLSFPIGTRLLRMSVKVTTALVGSLSAISLQGSSPLTIAQEFADYFQGVGVYNIDLMNLPELDSSLAGKLKLSQPGSGTGTGIIYLEYITSMER